MTSFTPPDPPAPPTASQRLALWCRNASLAARLLTFGGALFTAAVTIWSFLASFDLMTPASFTVLGALAGVGAAAVHAAAAVAAVADLRHP